MASTTFRVRVDCDNDAFTEEPSYEVISCLQRVITKLEQSITEGPILDTNGNTVGYFAISGEQA